MKTDKTDKMKTKEEFIKGVLTGTTYYTKGSREQHEAILMKALQEHTDQDIAEYKRKLKELVIKEDIGFVALRIIELIDTTTI